MTSHSFSFLSILRKANSSQWNICKKNNVLIYLRCDVKSHLNCYHALNEQLQSHALVHCILCAHNDDRPHSFFFIQIQQCFRVRLVVYSSLNFNCKQTLQHETVDCLIYDDVFLSKSFPHMLSTSTVYQRHRAVGIGTITTF